MTPKERIIAIVFIVFLAVILLFTFKGATQKRKLFSEASFSTAGSIQIITPTIEPVCRDGTPSGACCKSGHRCVEAGGAYLCIGSSCD